MFRDLGPPLSDAQWQVWRRAAVAAVVDRDVSRVGMFVVDHPDVTGALVACGAGVVSDRLPNPWHPDGLAGYVQWMSTEPAFRRRGLARAVLRAILEWFDERGVDNVELHATDAGAPLYRSEGFWRGSSGEPMRRRAWDPPPD
jgi:GNAT superfamily N-acetyltransferase